MKSRTYHYFIYSLSLIGTFCFITTVYAQDKYTPLQPIPGVTEASDLPTYLKALFELGIAAAGLLAVLMIMYGGVKYMSTEAYSGKSDAKDIIIRSLLGLLIAFASWLILYTINPDLLNLDLKSDTLDTTPTDPDRPSQDETSDLNELMDDPDSGLYGDYNITQQGQETVIVWIEDSSDYESDAYRIQELCEEAGFTNSQICRPGIDDDCGAASPDDYLVLCSL